MAKKLKKSKHRHVVINKKKFYFYKIWTFASYDQKDEAYSDRNIFPTGVIIRMEKLNVESR